MASASLGNRLSNILYFLFICSRVRPIRSAMIWKSLPYSFSRSTRSAISFLPHRGQPFPLVVVLNCYLSWMGRKRGIYSMTLVRVGGVQCPNVSMLLCYIGVCSWSAGPWKTRPRVAIPQEAVVFWGSVLKGDEGDCWSFHIKELIIIREKEGLED